MHHLMVAKFKQDIAKEDIKEMFKDIKGIYEKAREIEGVSDVIYHLNCIDRPNRYDLSVDIVMEKASLPLWDSCAAHKEWKSKYGSLLESKCIFDYED